MAVCPLRRVSNAPMGSGHTLRVGHRIGPYTLEASPELVVHGMLPGFAAYKHAGDGTVHEPITARFLQVWEPMRLVDAEGNSYDLEPGDYRIPETLVADGTGGRLL